MSAIYQLSTKWEGMPAYPIPVAEAQGAMFGTDFVLFSGFTVNFFKPLTKKCYAYDTRQNTTGTWREMDDFPAVNGSTHGAFVIIQNIMYLCGGYVGAHPGPATNLCWKYDHSAARGMQWSTMPSLPGQRSGGGMIHDSVRNTLLFATGASRPNPLDPIFTIDHPDVWQLDLNNINAGWVTKPILPYQGNHIGFVTLNYGGQERHFFLGGQHGEEEKTSNLAHMYEWDASGEKWIERKSLLFPRGHFSSSTNALSTGCGFVISGGATNDGGQTSEVHYYDLPTDTWSVLGNLKSRLNTPVCSIQSNYLYCESGHINKPFSWRTQITY